MTLTTALANHLWQSTVVWLLLWALMPILRQNGAAVRSRLWMAASLKFLFPFALLSWVAGVVEHMHAAQSAIPARIVSNSVLRAETPFIHGALTAPPLPTNADILAPGRTSDAPILICLWGIGMACVAVPWVLQWMRLRRLVSRAELIGTIETVPIIALESATEPAVFGLFHPVLLLPRGIEQRLSPKQMEAVLAHELCHIRRRDNLQYALHRLVSTIFWFHPAVWVIRKHLLLERELACDEAVLAQGGAPDLYAEGILSVCRWHLEAAPECMAGISGMELKERVRRILAARPAASLSLWRRVLLAVVAGGVISLPMGVGLIDAEQGEGASAPITTQASSAASPGNWRQELRIFDVVTIKPSSKADGGMGLGKSTPDSISLANTSARSLIAHAYGLPEWAIEGGPSWMGNTEYDIEAKILPDDHGVIPQMNLTEIQEGMKGILAERFGLISHFETRKIPVYELRVIVTGARLKEATPGDSYANGISGPNGRTGPGLMRIKDHMFIGQAIPISGLVETLSLLLQRTVVDKTGLTGLYDISLPIPLEKRDVPMPPTPASGSLAPDTDTSDSMESSLFTELRTQLGLKLSSAKGEGRVLVVEHIDKPSLN